MNRIKYLLNLVVTTPGNYYLLAAGIIIPLSTATLYRPELASESDYLSSNIIIIILITFGMICSLLIRKSKYLKIISLTAVIFFSFTIFFNQAVVGAQSLFSIVISAFGMGLVSGLFVTQNHQFKSTAPNPIRLILIGVLIGYILQISGQMTLIQVILFFILTAGFTNILLPDIKSLIQRISIRLTAFTKSEKADTALPFFIAGIHFGLMQIALFFIVQCFMTATFLGYFAVAIAWLIGVILSLIFGRRNDLVPSLIISIVSYLVLIGLTAWLPPYHVWLPIYAILIILTALPAGSFFRTLSKKYSATSLFFHENNGFVLGFILSMLGFVQWGVYFLYSAPFITAALILLVLQKKYWIVYFIPAVLLVITYKSANSAIYPALIIVYIIAVAYQFIKPKSATKIPSTKPGSTTFRGSNTNRLVLFIAGFNLILLQYFITREFSIILAAAEVTVLIVGAAYFAGFSVGYGVARYLSAQLIRIIAPTMFILHLTALLFSRFAAGYLISAGFGMLTMVVLLFLTAFGTSSFYSVFLPKLIEERGSKSLASSYSWDLLGAICGSILMVLLTFIAPNLLWPLYFSVMLILVMIIYQHSTWKLSILLGGFFLIFLLYNYGARIHQLGTEDYYYTRGYDNPVLTLSDNSFYHSIDIIDTFEDTGRQDHLSRWAFLNGIVYFGYKYDDNGHFAHETGLSEFTYFLAELPAKYLYQKRQEKLRILIFGCGSMYSIGRVSPFASKTTLVEIDAAVIESAKTSWYELNRFDHWDNYELVVDDAKHYLLTSDEKFDLIIMDISAPYNLGTMLLHNQNFYQNIRQHLKPGGIFAESTQGRPRPHYRNSQSMKILKGVVYTYPYYRVIDCTGRPRGKHGFVYASSDTKFDSELLSTIMKSDRVRKNSKIYDEENDHFDLSDTRPYSLTSMETLLSGNLWRIEDQLLLDIRGRPDYKMVVKRNRQHLARIHFRLPTQLKNILWRPSTIVILGILIVLMLASARYSVIRKRQTKSEAT